MTTTEEATAAIATITDAQRLIEAQQKELENYHNLVIRLVSATGVTVEKLDNGTHILKAHAVADEDLNTHYELSFRARENQDGTCTITVRLKPEP